MFNTLAALPTRLAIRYESFVESDGAPRIMTIESKSEEDLLRHRL